MAEEQTAAPEGTEGQADVGADTPTDTAPEGTEGQAAGTGTSETAPQTEDTFFDPREVPDDLQPAYKQMQAAFTKKMQAIAENRQKVEAYDAFQQDPIGQIQRLAQQYGYTMTRAEAAQVQQEQQSQNQNWEPQSWDDVLSRAEERAYNRIRQELQPMFSEVQQMKKTSIEHQLAEIDPTWQQYEDKMTANLKQHPTLAQDPAMLYRLSVPQDVLESRAVQKALKKMEAKGQSAQVAGGSTTTKQPKIKEPTGGSFQDAVKYAESVIKEHGPEKALEMIGR